jgi:hypothetical protein
LKTGVLSLEPLSAIQKILKSYKKREVEDGELIKTKK